MDPHNKHFVDAFHGYPTECLECYYDYILYCLDINYIATRLAPGSNKMAISKLTPEFRKNVYHVMEITGPG